MTLIPDRPWPRRHLLGTAGALCLPGRLAAQGAIGRVEALLGEATAEASGARRQLGPAMPVLDGDLVATGVDSRVTLRLAEVVEVRIGATVRLRIDRFLARAGGTLTLERGAMLLDRRAASGTPAPEVAVRSPFGLIAVRGTRFFAGPSNGVFGVFVERGSVLLVGAGQAVELQPGFGADIAAPGAAPTAAARWAAPRVQAALASVT